MAKGKKKDTVDGQINDIKRRLVQVSLAKKKTGMINKNLQCTGMCLHLSTQLSHNFCDGLILNIQNASFSSLNVQNAFCCYHDDDSSLISILIENHLGNH